MFKAMLSALGLLLLANAARANEPTPPPMIEMTADPWLPAPGTSIQVLEDPAINSRRLQGISGPVDAVLTVTEGLGVGAVSYVLWIFLHEGSHAAMVEAVGGRVTGFDWLPTRGQDGNIVFATTYWESPEGRIFTQNENVAIDLAPNMTAFVAAAVGATLWASGTLPDNRYARLPFTAFQAGAAINLGIMFTLSHTEGSDAIHAMQAMGLDHSEQSLMKAGMFTLSVLAWLPVADGVVHAVSGRTLFPHGHRQKDEHDGRGVWIVPVFTPQFSGVTGTF